MTAFKVGRFWGKTQVLSLTFWGLCTKSVTLWLCDLGHLLKLPEIQFLYLRKGDSKTFHVANVNIKCDDPQLKA